LLRQQPDVGDHILHLAIGQLSSPGMHWTVHDAVFDRAQQFLIRFQVRIEPMKVGRWNSQYEGVRPIAPPSRPIAGKTLAPIPGLSACNLRRTLFRKEDERRHESSDFYGSHQP